MIIYYGLLFVAENTAKTAYNAIEPVDPFDEDSSWWLVRNAKSMADVVKDPSFEDAVWNALTGGIV